ncbi:unnamed protein product [Meganyctiphanes norvegica]|uniref:Maturase K n=1 Tax=Meganyctiphanes norvegica TaxID=48144 RepID=A0AAV2PVI1_MEGNR
MLTYMSHFTGSNYYFQLHTLSNWGRFFFNQYKRIIFKLENMLSLTFHNAHHISLAILISQKLMKRERWFPQFFLSFLDLQFLKKNPFSFFFTEIWVYPIIY